MQQEQPKNAATAVATPIAPMAVRDLLVAQARVDMMHGECVTVIPTHTVVTQRALLRGMVLFSGGPIGESIVPFISVEGTASHTTVLANFAPNQREDVFLREDRRILVLAPHRDRAMQQGLRLADILFPGNASHAVYTAPPLATYRLTQGSLLLFGNAAGTGLGVVIYCLPTSHYVDIALGLSLSLDHLYSLYHSFWEQQQQQPPALSFAFPALKPVIIAKLRVHPGLQSFAVPPTATVIASTMGNNNNNNETEAVQALVGLSEQHSSSSKRARTSN